MNRLAEASAGMNSSVKALFDPAHLSQQLADGTAPLPLFRQAIAQSDEQLHQAFLNGAYIRDLVHLRTHFFDQLLQVAWNQLDWPETAALLAVGGYGRGELHPASDIDLLLLLENPPSPAMCEKLEQFVTFLWDLKLDIGHSVRTLDDCVIEAEKDLTVITNLLECRTVVGPDDLMHRMQTLLGADRMWSSREFFYAKHEEQRQRHRKYDNTEYNLEPDVKSSPGGLRDIQQIGWVAKRHFGCDRIADLVGQGFITQAEYDILISGEDFLWQVRWALQQLTSRPENRLLFDHQRELAVQFGYQNTDQRLAVEQFMQRYYRCVLAIGELSDVLLQYLDEDILRACEKEVVNRINPRFQVRNQFIELIDERVFSHSPSALLEVFVLMAQDPKIKGVRAATIRLLRDHRHAIDDEFRADPVNRQLFIELLRSPHQLVTQLRRMKRYGILGRYLPEFGRVIGQMQHDLFHIYTVDAHTLMVIRNARRFSLPESREQFPVAAHIVKKLPRIELLYIAALYHDIAKGRGGDHSELGAQDARNFCARHGLARWEGNLVAWLVLNHLLMSTLSQRQDISDPDVIRDFALEVGDQLHLDYLYALTVADINATNPKLWNGWRASLLRQLYLETKRALRRGLENTIDKQERIEDTQRTVLRKLADKGFSEQQVLAIWDNPGDDYFLREPAADIVWHTEAVAEQADPQQPLVIIKDTTERGFEGATQIFVHMPNGQNLFAAAATVLDQLGLDIQDARIYTSASGYSLDTFYVLDGDGHSFGHDPLRTAEIYQVLLQELVDLDNYSEIIQRRTPRQLKSFAAPTLTTIGTDIQTNSTALEVISPDRPGLLARLGRLFVEHNLRLQSARIATLGERVEDVFFLTDQDNQPISDADVCQRLQTAICQELDQQACQ